jgi:hypothetical protein
MTSPAPWVDAPRPCFDPEGPGTAQPEEDGSLRYYACDSCGYEGGFEQVRVPQGSCSLGIPEDVRRKASHAPPEPVLLQIGKRPQ